MNRKDCAIRPLAGIRVLDLTQVLAGPFCCQQLAHLGAEVIKVEAPGHGDLARRLGADEALNALGMGVSFLAQNAGKKSIALDLKQARAREIFERLVGTADVLVENFRPGVMARLGLGYEALRQIRPPLIYCAISGFGQDGPWATHPAYDQIVQGLSGVMSVTGETSGAPLRVGFPVADTIGGMTAAFAITAALNARPRGTQLDVSMLESMLTAMGWVVSNHLIAGVQPRAHGNENPTSAPSGTFEASDGPINIAANKDEQWRALAHHLGLADLCEQADYRSREARKRNRQALTARLNAVLRTRPAAQWVEELNRIGVPAGAVLTVPQVLLEPQVAGRGLLRDYPDVPRIGRGIRIATTGIKVDGQAPVCEHPPPDLGQHTDEVLRELGLSCEQISALRADGAI